MNITLKRKVSINSGIRLWLKVLKKDLKKDALLYILLILPVLYFIIFRYIPIAGLVLAFRRYMPGKSIFGEQWVGLRYFNLFINDPSFWTAFKNNIIISVLNISINFPIPIIFALLLNEINNSVFKKVVQTVTYLPRFISTVVVVGMIKEILSPSTGAVNLLLKSFGYDTVFFINEPEWFRAIYISSHVWQYTGWSAIIYIAALSSIDMALYEAAMIDGANRFKQTIYITIPGIMPIIMINLILSVGHMLSVGFEKILLLYTPTTMSTADVISTFVYRMGIEQNSYSYATAVGLFEAIIGLGLVLSTNYIARKFSETSLF